MADLFRPNGKPTDTITLDRDLADFVIMVCDDNIAMAKANQIGRSKQGLIELTKLVLNFERLKATIQASREKKLII